MPSSIHEQAQFEARGRKAIHLLRKTLIKLIEENYEMANQDEVWSGRIHGNLCANASYGGISFGGIIANSEGVGNMQFEGGFNGPMDGGGEIKGVITFGIDPAGIEGDCHFSGNLGSREKGGVLLTFRVESCTVGILVGEAIGIEAGQVQGTGKWGHPD